MIKLRVHDLAGEFGIANDELISMLRSMDVPVRSHLSQLSDDQIARLRARWEREKRARQEKPAAAPARRRRGASAASASVEPAPTGKKPAKTSRTSKGTKKVPEPEPAPVAPVADAAKRRRRTKADIEAGVAAAAQAAERAAERAAEVAAAAAAAAPPPPVFADLPAPADPEHERAAAAARSVPGRESDPRLERPAAATTHSTHSTPSAPEWQRPRPIVPGPPRPKPIASGAPYSARPVASGAPSATATGMPTRRDDKRGGKRGKKGKRGAVDQEAVTANISKTMTAIRGAPARRGPRRSEEPTYREEVEAQRAAEAERERTTVRVNEFITVSELAAILKVPATQIVAFAFKNLGLPVTVNQRLDFDQIDLIASEFGFQAVREAEYQVADAAVDAVEERPEDLVPRPPVVTIMGHVDHGKTSLLDYIRKASVVAGEAGGITQHIGAYHVSLPNGKAITFLDTPGHEAFTAMRARGAQVTDIVVLVVAADDQVMPQTIEAISHAKNAGVPIVVAINKIDLAQANVQKVRSDLLQHGVVLEEFGGTTLATAVSAKKGTGVAELLEQILLQAELLELKANPNKRARGTVIEAQLDPGKGPVATVLVQSGTLKVGDDFICGNFSGRVRALLDERGRAVKSAGPAIPVQVLGVEGVPMAGDQLLVVVDAAGAREVAQTRQRLDREQKNRRTTRGALVSLEDFMAQTQTDEQRHLRLLIKADQGGPAEALADALAQLTTPEVMVEVVHRGVGAITESDILLAKASGAIIVGFHVRPDTNARAAADREGVDIKLYRVIYEAVDDVRAALSGLLRPEEKEVVLGEAEVLQLFKVPKAGVIAGCAVRSGSINRTGRVRVVRDSVQVYDGVIGSLRRFKDDVKEVREGFECGIGIENFNDLKVGDRIECYRTEQVARTL